tara:strand:+ start:21880 stop:24267 length:2388 start_codon:yes stop_codon:yes gene_type:complete
MLSGFQQTILAQKGILTGTVYDATTGETIPLANIVKEGTLSGTYSNDDGVYSISLNPGSFAVRFSSLSYIDTLITVIVRPNETIVVNVNLAPDLLLMDEIVISADRVTRKVQELAVNRNKLNSGLKTYTADIYKLAILGSNQSQKNSTNSFTATAFSERFTKVKHILKPERFTETILANRASKNFFSEYDFFSTGGPPLNLNQELVPLSVLTEDITVVGPISKRAGRFYYLSDSPADSTWPEGTIKISAKPKFNNRPLFNGSIWYDEFTSTILGIDVTLNEYASTSNGLFSISKLRYVQTYHKIDEFWLPDETKLSARLSFFGTSNPIIYKDEWKWINYSINPPDLKSNDLELNTSIISPNAHRRKTVFWDSLSINSKNENSIYLSEAQSYTEKNRTLRLGMSVMSNFFRLPYQLERFYLTNLSDIYHFNRVEGHYLGLGLRTPIHSDYEYRAISGYGFSNKELSYKFKAHHYIPGTAFAPEFTYQNQITVQYQDYEYNRTPLDFYDFRQSMSSLLFGSIVNNYFQRKGTQLGLRYRFDIESFIRVLYLNEEHSSLNSATDFSLFGEVDPLLYPNNDTVYPTQNGNLKGVSIHFHHDTRKYLRTQFLRDYNVRDFGWLIDGKLEKGVSNWGSDFDYNRYRIGLSLNIPVFSSHFIQSEIITGASDSGTPNQRLFGYNGFVLDDYVRVRPFNTISFKEPIGYRVSLIKVKYKFGSSITRKAPFNFIQKSGIHLATFFTIGVIDEKASLEPFLPYSNSETQAELGIAAFKIFGFMYVEFSRRLIGNYGNNLGLTVLF